MINDPTMRRLRRLYDARKSGRMTDRAWRLALALQNVALARRGEMRYRPLPVPSAPLLEFMTAEEAVRRELKRRVPEAYEKLAVRSRELQAARLYGARDNQASLDTLIAAGCTLAAMGGFEKQRAILREAVRAFRTTQQADQEQEVTP